MLEETDRTVSLRICQEGHANALALNKDSSQIAVAGRSLLKVFSIETDGFTEVCNMRGGKNPNLSYSSNDVAWSHLDTNILATAATNGVVSVWDLSKFGRQKQLLVYNQHERTAHSVIFHATEAHLLISGSQDGTIKCFDLRVDKVALNTYFSNSESVRDVKFNPHAPNTFAAVSENGTVQLWDIRRADRCTLQFTAHSGPIYCCDWHPANQWLATGSRDRLIKIWNMGLKPQLEHTIHTIANVGRVKWRPEKTFHIASCALMMDYSIYVWDVRRPYIPYMSFNQHTNVTTGIAFKGQNPHCLLSTSKDSTIYKHMFRDAQRPSLSSNPVVANINYKGDLLFAYKIKNVAPAVTAGGFLNSSKASKAAAAVDQFHMASSNLQTYTTISLKPNSTNKDVIKTSMLNDYLALKGCANDYILSGRTLLEMCDHNSQVAKKYGKHNVSLLWDFVRQLYSSANSLKPLEQRNSNASQNLSNRLMTQNSNQSGGEEKLGLNESNGVASDNEELNDLHYPNQCSGADLQTQTSCASMNRESPESSNYDFVFGETELTIENMDSCMKSFRNGFLYTGPHDLMKEWSFPNSSSLMNDLPNSHTHHHQPQQHHHQHLERKQETSPPPELPSVLKIVNMPTVASWRPHQVLTNCLLLQTEIGDVQTSASILICLGDNRNELAIDELVHENWLLAYIELLHRHQLWNEASQIMNLSWIPSIGEMNQQSTSVIICCGECGKPMLNPQAGWYCSKCKSADSSKCGVCRLIVRGLYVWCQGCGHGGHLEHMKTWFANQSKCPQCDHTCEYRI